MNNFLIFIIILAVNAILTRMLLRNLSYYLMSLGVSGIDVNKPHRPRIPEEGGVAIGFSFIFSLALYGYIFNIDWVVIIITTTFLISFIGFIDHFRNIKPYPKFVYCAVVGSFYSIYYLQSTPEGIMASVIFVVIISLSYSVLVNAFNLLAGFNGLESGLAVLSSLTLAIYFYLENEPLVAGVALLLFVGFLVFWQLNKYPAQIFLGDSGSLIPASVFWGLAAITQDWLPILIVMAPHLLNALIKFASTGVSSRSDHKPLVYKNGLLYLPEKNYWSLIRLYLLTGPKHEKQIVYYVYAVELFFCILLLTITQL
jgi:UDP-N-acetylglucosamine--dolichyl-phosphate N-acetylglucosaminephosphotransferase